MATTQQKHAPALRFKNEQGKEYPDWVEKKLGDVGNIVGGGTPSTNKKSLWDGDIVWFTPTEIKSKYSKDSIRKISEEGLAQSSATLLPVGAILFTSRATIGDVSIASKECTTNQGFQSFVVNSSLFSNEYIYYWLLKNKWQFLRRANGSTFLEIGKSEIKKIPFSVPSVKEQQKIAAFLSSVDTKIEQLSRKKALWERYKQGMMQKLFSQEIRFKDEQGKDYLEWECLSLDEIATIVMGTSPISTAYNQNKEGLPLIQGNADIKNRKSAPKIYTTVITKECLPNDTLLSVRAPVGEVSLAVHHACIGRGMASIRAKGTVSVQTYLYNYLIWHESQWRSISQGSTFESVNSNDIRSLRINTPSIFEQQKIADFLSAIDKKIELVAGQLEQARTFKKGLLQQMLI